MEKDRFERLCLETETGHDAIVRHQQSSEEGVITGCDLRGGVMLIQTPERQFRRWEFDECEDLRSPKSDQTG